MCFSMPQSMKKIKAGPYIDERQIIGGHFIDLQTVEKDIYYFFIKYLRDYFALEWRMDAKEKCVQRKTFMPF